MLGGGDGLGVVETLRTIGCGKPERRSSFNFFSVYRLRLPHSLEGPPFVSHSATSHSGPAAAFNLKTTLGNKIIIPLLLSVSLLKKLLCLVFALDSASCVSIAIQYGNHFLPPLPQHLMKALVRNKLRKKMFLP